MEIEIKELDAMGEKVCNPIRERRFGRFSIDLATIEKDDSLLTLFYSGVVVLDARANACSFGLEYQVAYKDLPSIPVNGVIPEYNLIFTKSTREVGTGNTISSTTFRFEPVINPNDRVVKRKAPVFDPSDVPF